MNVNNTGYTKGSSTEKNSYNIIPGNKITMKKVKGKVLAIKLNKSGKPIGMKFMTPGKDYKFDDAHSVMEIPKYRAGVQVEGSKMQFDENGNPILGADSQFAGGKLPEGYLGGSNNIQHDINGNPIMPNEAANLTDMQIQNKQFTGNELIANPKFGANSTLEKQGKEAWLYGLEGDANLAELDGEFGDLDSFLTSEGVDINNTSFTKEQLEALQNQKGGVPTDNFIQEANIKSEEELEANPDSYTEDLKMRRRPNIQFMNPYSSVDIPTAATTLGSSIESGNTLGIIGSAGKLVTGLGRNITGGIAQQRRSDFTMKEYYDSLDEQETEYLQKGGEMKKSKILTGEYITGVDQEDPNAMSQVNAEVSAGEYIKTNEGDVAEVVGRRHSSNEMSGEKLPLEEGERVLTDDTKLGAKNAKNIRDNFDINVRAKNTYSDVLDKFRVNIGFKSLLKEEEETLEKLEEEEGKDDSQTKGLNKSFLENKLAGIRSQKEPIEEARKMLYDSLFEIQERSKPNSERTPEFQDGGIKEYQKGGMYYADIDGEVVERKINDNVTKQALEYSKILAQEIESGKRTFTPSTEASTSNKVNDNYKLRAEDNKKLQKKRPKAVGVGDITPEDIKGSESKEDLFKLTQEDIDTYNRLKEIDDSEVKLEDIAEGNAKDKEGLNTVLLPDQYARIPEGIEPHLLNRRRFDRVEPMRIEAEPYLTQIFDANSAASRKSEGFSPNVRAAIDANREANTLKSLSGTMNKVDAINLASFNKAEQTNSVVQRMEENARVADNLSFEQRQLTAKAKTSNNIENYFDKNMQTQVNNYATINALNNANSRSSDIQYTGSEYITSEIPKFEEVLYQQMLAKMQEENKTKK